MKPRQILTKIINIINNNKVIFMVLVSALALLLRFKFIEHTTGDYDLYLHPWCSYLKENGGFRGIASVSTDYNAIYLYFLALFSYIPIKDLYLIKFLSFLFDYTLAFAGSLLISHLKRDNKFKNLYSLSVFSGILLMPTVVLNSASWAQCDSIYVAFIFLSLYFMLNKKYNLSFILYGVSITFKLQAIFILPAYGILYLKNRDFSFLKFLWVPLVNFILYIPAILLGKPITSVLDAYLIQTANYSYKTSLGYPNIYYFFSLDKVALIKPGIILTMIILFAVMLFVLFTKGKLTDEDIIELSVTVLFLVTFFLPKMHDRYGYAAEALSLVYFFMIKRDWIVLLIININALVAYSYYLIYLPEKIPSIIAVYQTLVVFYFVRNFIKNRIKNKDTIVTVSNKVAI